MIIASATSVGTVSAAADSGNTSAVAVNTRNGSSVFKLRFAIRRVTGSVVDNQNVAAAYSSCTTCQTVAISIQILLITSDVTTFTPANEAIAINQNCDLCDTLAAAYQFAVATGTELKFTADGRQQIAQIRHELEQLRGSGLTGPQIDARVTALMSRLITVLQADLVGIGDPAGGHGATRPAPVPPTAADPVSTAPTDNPTTPTGTAAGTTPTTTSPPDPAATTTTPSTTASPTTTTTPTPITTPSTTTTDPAAPTTPTASTTPTATTPSATPTTSTTPTSPPTPTP